MVRIRSRSGELGGHVRAELVVIPREKEPHWVGGQAKLLCKSNSAYIIMQIICSSFGNWILA